MNTRHYFVRIIIPCYALLLVVTTISCLSLKRKVLLVNRQEFGVVIISGVKHPTPFREQVAMPTFIVDNPIDYLFLSNGENGDCLVSLLLKLGVCIMLEIILWNFDINDPFNKRYIKHFRLIGYLLVLFLVSDFWKNVFTSNWVNTFKGGLDGYQYKVPNGWYYYIIVLFMLSVVIKAYRKAVKNERDLELVI